MPLDFESGDLSVHVVPSHYHLALAPRGEMCCGRVEIDLQVENGFTGHIIPIHAASTIGIVRATLYYPELKETFEAKEIVLDTIKTVQVLHFALAQGQDLPLGSAQLALDFVSTIQTQKNGNGIYRIDEMNGYATQFEPIGARSAFPCFDEPAIRTTFQLDLTVSSHQQAWSNTEIEQKTEHSATTVYRFARTMKMSSYLVAFVVGNFHSSSREIEVTDGKDTRKITISIVSTCTDPSGFQQPLDWACNAVSYFSKTFQCFLPINKLDLVEIPLSGLGMENFGLATFRTGYLTITDRTTVAIRNRICLLILHEISHMWFGDMVTVRWWSYLYLKEGFARLLEYTVATILYPENCWWDHFLSNHYGPSRILDMSPRRTHPVEMPIHRARDAEDIFDFISYAKGASVLRMSSDVLGSERFLAALPDLINTHLYHSIDSSDLWKCFQRAQDSANSTKEGESTPGFVIDSLETWVKRPGHPTIAFTTEASASSSASGLRDLTLHFTQHLHCGVGQEDLFRVTHPLAPYCQDSEGRVCYPIPVVEIKLFFPDGSSKVVNKPLYEHSASYTLTDILPAEGSYTVLLNASHRGYFAVEYTEEQWDELLAILDRCSTTEILGLLIELSQSIKLSSDDLVPGGRLVAPTEPVSNPRMALLERHCIDLMNTDINAYLDRIAPKAVKKQM